MVRSKASPSTSSSLPDSVRKQVAHLEREAARVHLEAQQLNKAGKFDEANRAYEEMNAIERRALDLAAAASTCPSCEEQQELQQQQAAGGEHHQQQQLSSHSLARSADHYARTLPSCHMRDAEARRRAAAAVCGAYVADCASVGVQWIYDVGVLEDLLMSVQKQEKRRRENEEENGGEGGGGNAAGLEFLEPVASPFLKADYKTGRPSPYGEETLVLIRALAKEQAAEGWGLHCGRYAEEYARAFGGGGGGDGGDDSAAPPAFKGYLNASTRGFLRNYSAQGLMPPWSGADDKQADCVARVAPVVAAFGGQEGEGAGGLPLVLPKAAEMATRVTQNDDEAVAWACAAALVLQRVVLGARIEDAASEVVARLESWAGEGGEVAAPLLLPMAPAVAGEIAAKLRAALERRGESPEQAVAALGRNCHLPNSYQTPLQAALYGERAFEEEGKREQAAFVAAIRGALLGGGCCASRAQAAGALLAARLGREAIPEEWKRKCADWQEVEEAAGRIAGAEAS
jgi:ADP-ribosylglycohydrolase